MSLKRRPIYAPSCRLCAMCCPVKNLAELADLTALYKRCHRQGVWCASSASPTPISLHKGHGSSIPSRYFNGPELTDYPHSKLHHESVIYSPKTDPRISGWKCLLYRCYYVHYVYSTVTTLLLPYSGHFTFTLPCLHYVYCTVATLRFLYRGHFTFILPWTLYFYSTVDTLRLLYRGHFTFSLP